MMKSKYVILAIAVVMMSALFMGLTFSKNPDSALWKQIAVSEDGQVYLGTNKYICLITKNGELNPILDTANFRDYRFVLDGDRIRIVKGRKCYEYSKDGSFLLQTESDGQLYNELSQAKYAPLTWQGVQYQIKSTIGYQQISKTDQQTGNTEIVYQMPVMIYIYYVLLILSILMLAFSIIGIVFGFVLKRGALKI